MPVKFNNINRSSWFSEENQDQDWILNCVYSNKQHCLYNMLNLLFLLSRASTAVQSYLLLINCTVIVLSLKNAYPIPLENRYSEATQASFFISGNSLQIKFKKNRIALPLISPINIVLP